jgi:uncharacterized protein
MDTVGIFATVWVLSAITLTTGVGAGIVYAPVFLLFFQMSPATATGTSILIQFAGVGATAVGHMRLGTADRSLAVRLALAGTVGLIVGRATYQLIPHVAAEFAFVAGLTTVGVWLVVARQRALPPPSGSGGGELRTTANAGPYIFCRPAHGYWIASLAGLATALIGVSGAGIQISALMLRCRIPAKIAVGTGTGAAAITLAVGSLLVATAGEVDWAVASVAVPAALLGSLTARLLARSFPARGLGRAVGILILTMAAGLTISEILL